MSRCYMHSAVFAVAFGIMSKRLNDAKIDRNYTATFKTITITLWCNWINYYLIMNEGT